MASDLFEIKFSNHEFLQINSIAQMLCDDKLTDCSLIVEGKTLRCHRVILAASSPYFLNLFTTPSIYEDETNPPDADAVTCIFSSLKYKDLFNVLKFIYTGVCHISSKDLVSFVEAGNMLQVKGLVGMSIDLGTEIVKEKKAEENLPAVTVKRAHENNSDDEEPIGAKKRKVRRIEPSQSTDEYKLDENDNGEHGNQITCKFCKRTFLSTNTQKNHERFCKENPDRKISTCPICKMEVKPGSITFHKKSQHGYIPKSRNLRSVSKSSVVAPSRRRRNKIRESTSSAASSELQETPNFWKSFQLMPIARNEEKTEG